MAGGCSREGVVGAAEEPCCCCCVTAGSKYGFSSAGPSLLLLLLFEEAAISLFLSACRRLIDYLGVSISREGRRRRRTGGGKILGSKFQKENTGVGAST